MKFTPRPGNDFRFFIDTYYDECRKRIPQIEAIAGKWRFEDLIPGMSDFDTRFICADGMSARDWCDMSREVGEAHLFLCRKYPGWARNLEHLPGINLTWSELRDDFSYYPEYLQWTFYRNNNDEEYLRASNVLENRKWESRDEYFHLKKFILYFTPYNRSIDPAVNLGPYENKYPLHSRIMHYFNPPVQSALSVILNKTIKGKKEAFRLAREIFPQLNIFEELESILEKHYEIEALYHEPALSGFESRLYEALKYIFGILKENVRIITGIRDMGKEQISNELGKVSIPPRLVIFDNCKFSRLMKGRLRFYANAPGHFDNIWTIQNELKRIGNNFYRTPFCTFWKILTGEDITDPDDIVIKLVPEYLNEREAAATLEFSRLAPGTWEPGKEVELALKIADVFDDFFTGLHKIMESIGNEDN